MKRNKIEVGKAATSKENLIQTEQNAVELYGWGANRKSFSYDLALLQTDDGSVISIFGETAKINKIEIPSHQKVIALFKLYHPAWNISPGIADVERECLDRLKDSDPKWEETYSKI